jgi:hypothetical protein
MCSQETQSVFQSASSESTECRGNSRTEARKVICNSKYKYESLGLGMWRGPKQCWRSAHFSGLPLRLRLPLKTSLTGGGLSLVLLAMAAHDGLAAQEPGGSNQPTVEGQYDPGASGSEREPLPDLSNVPVAKRKIPGYEPIGFRLGSVMFYPRLITGVAYDSNVFEEHLDPDADMLAVISPGATLVYERPDLDWAADFGADLRRYRDLAEEDTEDAHADFQLRKDLSSALEFRTRLGAARKHEMRGDSDAPQDAAEPPVYHLLDGQARFTRTFNRLGVSAGGDVRSYTYDEITTLSGEVQNQSFRDGTIVTGSVVPFYQLEGRNRLFTRLAVNDRNNKGTGDLNRDSQGYVARTGGNFEVTPLIFVSAEVGAEGLAFDNLAIDPINAFSFAANATWLVTPLLTASLSAGRSISEKVSQNFDARIDTSIRSTLDYELLRNVVVSAGAEYTFEEFIGPSGEDDVVELELGTKYLVNRWLELDLIGTYEQRDSFKTAEDFDRYMVWLNVTTQY